ncbi:cell division protein FtsL [Rhodobacter sp. NTK016B]|uniref:cell division protein FtsL n=1 Tax=Rhodobacter sp. NTK016B TaxID=2759676 RepID=UPI001A8DE5D2|nr:cell division protein FtsL [Rhodobacter sp. NTK016B]MBN8290517.1 cell division protein FtsL [Rhodobacter sp. NTK016B]
MRAVFYMLAAFGVIGLAIWAYDQNQKTQTALRDVRSLRAEIRSLNEALDVQQAEWAYLNRPQRLRSLAVLNFERLGLGPMEGRQFGQIEDVPYPQILAPTPEDTL